MLSPAFVRRGTEGWTTLHLAASCKNVDIASMLLDHGALIDAVAGSMRETPLHVAAQCGNESMVELLLQCGASDRVLDAKKMTPLQHAR